MGTPRNRGAVKKEAIIFEMGSFMFQDFRKEGEVRDRPQVIDAVRVESRFPDYVTVEKLREELIIL